MPRTIGDLISAVHKYDFCERKIPDYHHWRYALPLVDSVEQFDILLLGMAPKEQEADWTLHEGHTFESVGYDWRVRVGAYTQEMAEWRSLVTDVCQTEAVIQSNWFFWSTPDLDEGFEKRFGEPFVSSLHHHFCCAANLALIEVVQPQLVVVPDFEDFGLLSQFYGLTTVDGEQEWCLCTGEDGGLWLVMDEWTPESLNENGDWIREVVAEVLSDR